MRALYLIVSNQKNSLFFKSFLFVTCTLFSLSVTPALVSANVFLNGAGATFPFPLYSKWFHEYQKANPGVTINYQSIGSGGGIRQLTEQTVDFGASDAPMTDEMLLKVKKPVLHIPTVLGAVVITFNLPGVENIRLNADVLAKIFLGKIQKWNDTELAELNKTAKLPELPIIVVHRSDGSGTTHIFTDYLSKVNEEWKNKTGAGTAVKWPTGLGGKGNEGVTGLIKQTPGSIGYVELIYAESNKLPTVSLKNQSGKFVKPDLKSVTASAAGFLKSMPADFRVSITNASGKDAYPISGFTYLLVYKSMDKEKGLRLQEFLRWAVGPGQNLAEPLQYSKLPTPMLPKIKKTIDSMSF